MMLLVGQKNIHYAHKYVIPLATLDLIALGMLKDNKRKIGIGALLSEMFLVFE
jgi:hypothetical protein